MQGFVACVVSCVEITRTLFEEETGGGREGEGGDGGRERAVLTALMIM